MKLGEAGSRGQRTVFGKDRVTGPSVAIIGCGAVCERHMETLKGLLGVRVVGLCDRDRQAALRMSQRFGIEGVYADVDALLDDSRPDVVHILTPPATHARLALRAMESGAHVLVEKPMASDVIEAEAMIATARRQGVHLCVDHNFLFEAGILKAMELVERGALGRLVAVEIYWRVLLGRVRRVSWIHDLRGGVFQEVAPHPVYLVCAFLGTPRVISAAVSPTVNEFGPDELRVSLGTDRELGALAISTGAGPHQVWMRIYGSRSSLIVDLTTNTVVRLPEGGEDRRDKLARNLSHGLQLALGTTANALRYMGGRTMTGRERLIRAFYSNLERGGEPPVTGEDGKRTVSVLEEIWEALDR
ncbi:MAG TPA: Gfo/Idh/MocA family oxidoreductase [Gemmatimonadota bacterium]|nr:Gfo/Idh/MocA family oxidoreductase [Gemmatimonadota bacterium]